MKYELLNKDMKKIKKNDYKIIDFTGTSLLNLKKEENETVRFRKERTEKPLKAIKEQYVRVIMLAFAFILFLSGTAHASVRIKDMAYFEGVRDNQLIGYGLVVGLNGTGDKSQSVFTVKSIASLLSRMGISVEADQITPKNVAAVMITADLPPFIKPGARIDVTLSSLGDASSLQGGTLLLTPLQGADGNVYAVAQGQLSVGGFDGSSRGNSFGTVARIPLGAVIEKEVPVTLMQDDTVNLLLKKIDFTTSVRVAEAVNVLFAEKIAEAKDGAAIQINVPEAFRNNIVRFLAKIENIEVEPDVSAKIVINERTGTIVGGQKVKISRVSLTHKDINIEIAPQETISEEVIEKESSGTRSFAPTGKALFVEGEGKIVEEHSDEVTVGELAKTLGTLGISPSDMIAIFQAVKQAGAIQGDLEII